MQSNCGKPMGVPGLPIPAPLGYLLALKMGGKGVRWPLINVAATFFGSDFILFYWWPWGFIYERRKRDGNQG